MDDDIKALEKILSALSIVIGTSIIWKTDTPLHRNTKLSEDFRAHQNPFCKGVKNLGSNIEHKCILNDWQLISRKVFDKKESFIHCCHAGACELVIPFFKHDRFLGIIMCSPFRQEGMTSAYPGTNQQFERLPVFSPDKLSGIKEIIRIVAAQIMPLLMRLEEMSLLHADNTVITDSRIMKIADYLEHNFLAPVRIGQLASTHGLSRSRLAHLFKLHTGVSCTEFLQQVRISEACSLLRKTGLSISEIAFHCGIGDQSRLAVLIKRYTGVTPNQYRHKFMINHNLLHIQ